MPEWLRRAIVALRRPARSGLEDASGVAGSPQPSSQQRGLFLCLATVIPLVTIVATHLWLRSAYTSHVFHLQGFLDQYGSGIYRYRILGRGLLLHTYRLLAGHRHDQAFPMPTDPQATLLFYGAYVLLNAVFLFLTNLALLLFLWDRRRGISDLRLGLYFFLVFVMALSAYTVTPYDQLAYALMMACFLAMRARSASLMYAVLGLAAILGALNRETQFLVTPALLTAALFAEAPEAKTYFRAGIFHLVLFALCYAGLRVLLPGVPSIAEGVTLGGKWALPSLVVLVLLFYIAEEMAQREYRSCKPAVVLLVLSAPYIVTILISGELRELRLLIPLLLCLLFVYNRLGYSTMSSRKLPVHPA